MQFSAQAQAHAETLHNLLIADEGDRTANVVACRSWLNKGIPCSAAVRPHDLALAMFIESPFRDWHAQSSDDAWLKQLFADYLTAGEITMDGVLHPSTARDHAETSAAAQRMVPLELAIRRGSIEVACCLIERGCNLQLLQSWTTQGAAPLDRLLEAVSASSLDVNGLPMRASISAALMARHLCQAGELQPPAPGSSSRRSVDL